MFERPSSEAPGAYFPGIAPASLPEGRFPMDLELEFAEMRATAPVKSAWPVLLTCGLLFQSTLLAEFRWQLLTPRDFGLRGVCATLFLLAVALRLGGDRVKTHQPAWLMLGCALLTAALAGGVALETLNQMFLVQSGIAALLLLIGWVAADRRRWAVLGALSVLCVDGICLLLEPAPSWLGVPVRVASLWAPGFAASIIIMVSLARHQESRRDFLLLRHAALHHAVTDDPELEAQRIDAATGVAARPTFDLSFRAAWDAASSQRKHVALLFFSIDGLAEKKRDLGFRFVETLQRQVAEMLQDGLRQSGDMVARFDHQHFVVMLAGVGRDGTTQIAERLRGSIEQMAVYMGQKRHTATVTVGAASMRAKRTIAREQLIEAAVQALEQARAYGPNTVCVEGVGCVPRMS